MIKISPSILSADFARLEEEIKKVEPISDFIHIDVMDGIFVPNITIGPLIVSAIKKMTSIPLDVHLMIAQPDRYINDFANAGSDWITVHQEACIHLNRTVSAIKELGKKAGVSINPSTPANTLESIIEDVDLVLVMSVNPGFGGQKFIESSTNKIKIIRKMIDSCKSKAELSVDGGIKVNNVKKVAIAGATMFVAGSEIFHSKNPLKTAEILKKEGNI